MLVELEARVDVFAMRVIRTTGGLIESRKGTKKAVSFLASKLWEFAMSTEYLVGWNVLSLYKSRMQLKGKHPRLLTAQQLAEIDRLILPRLKDVYTSCQMDSDSDGSPDRSRVVRLGKVPCVPKRES